MYAVVIGAGYIGMDLIRYISKKGDKVGVIEKREEKCRKIANNFDAVIFKGDCTDPEILKNADLDKADIVFIVTDNDDVNMIVCSYAKWHFNVPQVVALSNSPKNKEAFKKLGADVIICPSELVIDFFECAYEGVGVATLYRRDEANCKIAMVTVPQNSIVVGKTIEDLKLPKDCRIGLICRENQMISPAATTEIFAGDDLFIVGTISSVESVTDKIRTAKEA